MRRLCVCSNLTNCMFALVLIAIAAALVKINAFWADYAVFAAKQGAASSASSVADKADSKGAAPKEAKKVLLSISLFCVLFCLRSGSCVALLSSRAILTRSDDSRRSCRRMPPTRRRPSPK